MILTLILASLQSIFQVMTIVLIGFLFAKAGYFSNDKQKWLSKLNLYYFTPCLLFTNVASSISFEKLLAFWPIPFFYYTFSITFYIITQSTTKLFGLSAPYRRFVLACVMFQNTNSVPLAVITSLAVSEAGKVLLWNSDDTPELAAARGISYTLFFAIFGNLLRWSYGYRLLQRKDTDELEDDFTDDEEEQINNPSSTTLNVPSSYSQVYVNHLHKPSSSSASSTLSSSSSTTTDELLKPGMPDRKLSSMTLAVTPRDEDQDPFKKLDGMNDPNERTCLLPSKQQKKQQQQQQQQNNNDDDNDKSIISFIKKVCKKIHSVMTPPLYAAFLALIVGLSPLKPILYDKQSFLYPSFTKAIESCGKAAVPIILSCLGAQLASISESNHTSPKIKKPVTLAVFIRMVMTPFFVIPIIVLFVKYGTPYSLLATDPAFITMMIILGCTPTAINLVQITQCNGIFEEEMLRMLFVSYGVVCVPVVTILVFLALFVVDTLL